MGEKELLLEKFAQQLAEHFDTVQIITTRHDPESNETSMVHYGLGNLFARTGSACAWIDLTEMENIQKQDDGKSEDEEGE